MAKLKETTVREDLYVKGDVYVWDYGQEAYRLLFAPAKENVLGGIMVGENLSVTENGVLSANLQEVDDSLSLTSTNPVQNQVLTAILNLKVDTAIASSAASITNKLMDQDAVETMIQSNNAVFRGSFDTWSVVPVDSDGYLADDDGNKIPKKNDYIVVNDASDYNEGGVSGKLGVWRFIYTGNWNTVGKLGWIPQYKMSDTFTTAQKAAINSNITAAKVEKYDAYDAQIQNRSKLGHTHPASQIDGLKNIATSGEYRDIYNVPTAGSGSNPVYFGTDATTKTGRPFACDFAIVAKGNTNTPVYFKADPSDGLIKPYPCTLDINPNTGSNIQPIYIDSTGKFIASTANVGATNKPIYMSNGSFIASSSNIGDTNTPIYMTNGILTECSANIGSATMPIYMNAGVLTASTSTVGAANKPIYMAGGVLTASSSDIGATNKPIYMSAGVLTASNSSIGSGTQPVYMASGVVTASTANVGNYIKPVYMANGVITVCSGTVGGINKPVYMNQGTITESNASIGGTTTPIYMSSGTLIASTSNIGSSAKPIYMTGGTLTASSSSIGSSVNPIYMESGSLKASASSIGGTSQPVYMSNGTITVCGGTVGSSSTNTAQPVYMNAGTITKISANIGSNNTTNKTAQPIYMTGGTLSAITSSIGGTSQPVYMSNGTITVCGGTVGSTTNPVYMNAGTITKCTYDLNKTVPSDAIFTDKNVYTTASTNTFYLTGKTTYANDTGTMVLNSNVYVTGGTTVVAKSFSGSLSGNATSADKVNKSITFATSGGTTSSSGISYDGSTAYIIDYTSVGALPSAVTAGTPSGSSANGWYYISSTTKTFNSITSNKGWLVQKVGWDSSHYLLIAHSLQDARVVFNSVDNSTWYSPYASWHA